MDWIVGCETGSHEFAESLESVVRTCVRVLYGEDPRPAAAAATTLASVVAAVRIVCEKLDIDFDETFSLVHEEAIAGMNAGGREEHQTGIRFGPLGWG